MFIGNSQHTSTMAAVGKSGFSTAFHQEWHLLQLSGTLHPNPCIVFNTNQTIKLDKWKAEGTHIILGGDLNETVRDAMDGLAHLVSTCNLTDVHTLFHGHNKEPATYVCGSK
jgi:hypothetical protein